MTDFNKIITDKITEMENSGTIQKIIEEKILKTIDSAINSCFSWEFEQQITKQIKESVGDIASKIKLNSYNSFIATAIENIVNVELNKDLKEKINTKLTQALTVTEKEIKLSKIIEKFKIYECDDEEEYSYCCNIKKDEDSSFKTVNIIIQKEDNDSFYNKNTEFEIHALSFKDEPFKISWVNYNELKYNSELAFIKDFNNFEVMLLKAIFNKIPFIIDMDEEEIENELYHNPRNY